VIWLIPANIPVYSLVFENLCFGSSIIAVAFICLYGLNLEIYIHFWNVRFYRLCSFTGKNSIICNPVWESINVLIVTRWWKYLASRMILTNSEIEMMSKHKEGRWNMKGWKAILMVVFRYYYLYFCCSNWATGRAWIGANLIKMGLLIEYSSKSGIWGAKHTKRRSIICLNAVYSYPENRKGILRDWRRENSEGWAGKSSWWPDPDENTRSNLWADVLEKFDQWN
jgi:hypothetical protein